MRILLVEDDPTTSRSIELMLTHANLNVYSTDLGEEGIDLAKLYDYDLILLDLGLRRRQLAAAFFLGLVAGLLDDPVGKRGEVVRAPLRLEPRLLLLALAQADVHRHLVPRLDLFRRAHSRSQEPNESISQKDILTLSDLSLGQASTVRHPPGRKLNRLRIA